jgi:hypothetical protein
MLASPTPANLEDDSLILDSFGDRSWIEISISEHTIEKTITHATPKVGEVREPGGRGARRSKMWTAIALKLLHVAEQR